VNARELVHHTFPWELAPGVPAEPPEAGAQVPSAAEAPDRAEAPDEGSPGRIAA
jgi:hypothetical protein